MSSTNDSSRMSRSLALPCRWMRVICSGRYSGHRSRARLIHSTSSWCSRLPAPHCGVRLLPIRSMASWCWVSIRSPWISRALSLSVRVGGTDFSALLSSSWSSFSPTDFAGSDVNTLAGFIPWPVFDPALTPWFPLPFFGMGMLPAVVGEQN